ncbi:MAG: hypothetical protein AAGA48_20660 [Myxococcota bacterium]
MFCFVLDFCGAPHRVLPIVSMIGLLACTPPADTSPRGPDSESLAPTGTPVAPKPDDPTPGPDKPDVTWSAVSIDFDDLEGFRPVVGDVYPEASFTSESGFDVRAITVGQGNSDPHYACTTRTGSTSPSCEEAFFVDFTRPIRGLRFFATGTNRTGPVATVQLFADSASLGTESIEGWGTQSSPEVSEVDLSGYTGVTRLEIVDVDDPAGLGWDDFTFEQQDP